MRADTLHDAILAKLAGSSSRAPVDLAALYKLGSVEDVQAALMGLMHGNEVCTCQITKRGSTRSVWWLSGTPRRLPQYGRIASDDTPRNRKAAP